MFPLKDRLKNKNGQQVIEFLVVVTAVAVVMIFFTANNASFKNAVTGVMDTPVNLINKHKNEVSVVLVP